jgi:hypothetical protein
LVPTCCFLADTEPLGERLILSVTKTMLEEIKDFWHENRLDSKAEAVRELIEAGLKAEGKRAKK